MQVRWTSDDGGEMSVTVVLIVCRLYLSLFSHDCAISFFSLLVDKRVESIRSDECARQTSFIHISLFIIIVCKRMSNGQQQ
jgi:hypothetical protein